MATIPPIPFSLLPPKILLKVSAPFMNLGEFLGKFFPFLQLELDRANLAIEVRRYVALCLAASFFIFGFLTVILTLLLVKIHRPYYGAAIALAFTFFIMLLQLNYPKIVARRRIRKLETDLLGALRAIMIQLHSGVPLFESMVIVSNQEFGEVSAEFKKAVRNISAGVPQVEALENVALQNPSPYFRRTLWQIINAIKEGAAINQVMAHIIENLTKEQIIQIEKYGSQLNPFAMFYMMGAVILPALGVTFLIVLASFIELSEVLLQTLFFGLLGAVVFFQFIFTGVIKTKRPSLLGE